jgi:hypothetical protein
MLSKIGYVETIVAIIIAHSFYVGLSNQSCVAIVALLAVKSFQAYLDNRKHNELVETFITKTNDELKRIESKADKAITGNTLNRISK